MTHQLELWIIFGIAIVGMLILDLAVINKKAHVISLKEASIWSIAWIAVSLIFNVLIYFLLGKIKALEFLTGYVIEKSLSVDNIFVFIMIFSYFNVPARYQPRVLKWGIIGAVIMRALFITVGVGLFKLFDWIIYVFGALLIYTAFKIALRKEEKFEPEKNPLVKLFKKFFRVTSDFESEKFFVKHAGLRSATPLFVTLLLIESSDIVFAVDSIPAILAITTDPFIVYTSNIFAILGLRALFFVVAGMMDVFRYLKHGISVILCFVGVKMLLAHIYKIPIVVSLGVIFAVLAVSILVSLIHKTEK
ncbi:MAG: TerC family protein [Candidatus Omnitrophota bacterium]|nr:TerC family protein [Candidatus Omnitrophota bacterium]